MMKKSRTILFIILLLAFAIIAPLIILYSQGYRFDLSKMEIVKIGGIYIKVYPGDAQIYIDGEYKQSTSMFSNDLLIQELLPGSHKIEIKKDGYRSWEKTLLVEEKKVVDSKYVILFPEQIPFTSIQENVSNFYPYPNANKLLITTTTNGLASFDVDESKATSILKNPLNISNIYFSINNKNIIIKTAASAYYLLPLDGKTNIPVLLKNLDAKTRNLFFDLNSDSIIYYQSNNQIYKLDTSKKQSPQLFKKEPVATFMLASDSIYYLEAGNIYKANTTINIPERLNESPFDTKIDSAYQLVLLENEIFLAEDNKTLYHLDKNGAFEKILESKGGIKYSSSGDRILFANSNELWLFLTKDTDSPFFKSVYSKIFISRFSEDIADIAWLNSDYFAYSLNNKAWISEVDNRNHVNTFGLPDISASKIFFSSNKKLFALNGNSLMVSDNKLIP